jgi:hypothetical protein
MFIAAVIAVSLALVPAASAYKVPGKPGSPGGPPTKPKGGDGTSKNAGKKVGGSIAGLTGSELAKKGKIVVKVHFPKAGKFTAVLKAGKTKLGQGSSSKVTSGDRNLTVSFSKSGKAFLNKHNGQAIKVTITVTFDPTKKGDKSSTSTSTVTLDA